MIRVLYGERFEDNSKKVVTPKSTVVIYQRAVGQAGCEDLVSPMGYIENKCNWRESKAGISGARQ